MTGIGRPERSRPRALDGWDRARRQPSCRAHRARSARGSGPRRRTDPSRRCRRPPSRAAAAVEVAAPDGEDDRRVRRVSGIQDDQWPRPGVMLNDPFVCALRNRIGIVVAFDERVAHEEHDPACALLRAQRRVLDAALVICLHVFPPAELSVCGRRPQPLRRWTGARRVMQGRRRLRLFAGAEPLVDRGADRLIGDAQANLEGDRSGDPDRNRTDNRASRRRRSRALQLAGRQRLWIHGCPGGTARPGSASAREHSVMLSARPVCGQMNRTTGATRRGRDRQCGLDDFSMLIVRPR